jgi:hypothetical protein
MMRVGDRNRKRIRRVSTRNFDAGEQPRDHRVNLSFVSPARADDGLLNKPRGIFANRNPRFRRSKQDHPARLAKLERRLRVSIDEHLLNRSALRLMREDDINQRPIKRHKPLSQRHFRVSANLAIGDVAQTIALCQYHAPARGAKAGIKTKDDQPSFSMISSLIS